MGSENSLKYRPDIDGLRAIAVLMVLTVHASPGRLPNGFVGVDLFFVISGYLITSILCREFSQERFSVRDFYVRRINRIFPALLLVLLFCLVTGPLWMYPSEYGAMSKSAFFSTLFAANIHFYLESGYWDVASKLKPLLHLWSLGVEEQFYLLWPLVLLWAHRTRRSLVLVCLGWMVVSFAVNLALTSKNPSAAFYLPFGRLWELSSGGLLACLQWNRAQRATGLEDARGGLSPRRRDALAWLGLALLVAMQSLRIDGGRFPGFYATAVVLAAVLMVWAGPHAWFNRKVLSHPAMVYIGKLSYPLYLWHWPLLVLARFLGDGQWTSTHRNLAVLASLALAALTYHGVERPLARRVSRKGWLAVALSALMLGTGTLAWFGFNGLQGPTVPRSAGPLETYDKPEIVSRGKIHLLGDSNAGHFFHGLSRLYGDRLALTAAPGWPYLDGVMYKPGFVPHRDHKGTPEMTEQVLRRIESDPEIQLVILSTAYLMYLPQDNLRSVGGKPSAETAAQAYEDGLRRTAQRLLRSHKKVVVVKSVPVYPMLSTVMACSPELRPAWRTLPADCARPRHAVESERRAYNALIERAVRGLQGVTVFDTLNDLCDSQHCYVNRNGIQLYVDAGHFTTAGSELMGAALARAVEQAFAR